MEYCIETEGLTKRFDGFVAVDNLNLQVEAGSFYGFLGPNGAGKTTTIRMLTGLTGPTSGSARILGYDLAKNALEIKKRIGVVLEQACLFENLTAREYLTFIARMYQVPRNLIADRCDELLNLMGLADIEKTLILEFSHGMQKKLSLAAALIHDPQLLFLDEPFEGIDPIASRTIRHILDRLIQRGSTIFLTSHILEIVGKLCTHVGIIHKGKLVSQGPLGQLVCGATLEDAFIAAVGEPQQVETSLSWLEETK